VPLRTYEVALNYLSSTRTASGLTVAAKLHSKLYQKGEEVTEEEMGRLNIRRHETLPEWNYTISPYNRDPSLSDVKKSPRVAKGLLLQPTSVA
jgi:hypothetical protein